MHRVCDRYGRFYALVPPGDYYLTVEKRNIPVSEEAAHLITDEEGAYTKIYTSGNITAKGGIINNRLVI